MENNFLDAYIKQWKEKQEETPPLNDEQIHALAQALELYYG